MSEDAAIITSMNLYEFSQQNNDEMGIHVSRSQEPALYKEIKDEALRLRRMADPRQGAPTETSPPTAPDQPLPTNRLLSYLTNMVVPLATVFVAKLHPWSSYFLLV